MPVIHDGVPYKADGQPTEVCAGFDARRRALAAAAAPAPLVEPDACGVCNAPQTGHYTRFGTSGPHTWQVPTDAQRLARMLVR